MVTLNADMGESLGIHSFGNDAELVTVIDTANIACGFHAGDPAAMRETVALTATAGVTIGAHPGLPDLVGFGRREMNLTPQDVTDIVRYQVGSLVAFLNAQGQPLDHIKPHGALYGMTARNDALMDAVCDVAVQYAVPIFGLGGTAHERVANRRSVPFIAEFYVDLEYGEDGSLIIPRRPGSTPPAVAADRATLAMTTGVATTANGTELPVRVDSICVHSDTPNAVQVARAVRAAIDKISAPSAWGPFGSESPQP